MRDGLVTAVDARPPAEFAVGHLPGAISLPPR
jgi:rhodanese-related sulfurtransferase